MKKPITKKGKGLKFLDEKMWQSPEAEEYFYHIRGIPKEMGYDEIPEGRFESKGEILEDMIRSYEEDKRSTGFLIGLLIIIIGLLSVFLI